MCTYMIIYSVKWQKPVNLWWLLYDQINVDSVHAVVTAGYLICWPSSKQSAIGYYDHIRYIGLRSLTAIGRYFDLCYTVKSEV